MGNNSVRRETISIDPMFFIPEGVDELAYGEDEVYDNEVSDDSSSVEYFEEDAGDSEVDDGEDFSEAPPTPDIIGILEQSVRTSATGSQVVDVVFDVEDLDGLSKYEVRISKV